MSSTKNGKMLFSAAFFLLAAICSLTISRSEKACAVRQASASAQHHNPTALFEGQEDEDLLNVQVPIPMKDRVFNKTGIQCVWASLECIGRYAEEKKLYNITSLPDCKSYSSPAGAASKLRQLGVKFEQTTSHGDRSLIHKAVVKEKRGVLFNIPGHAMVLVHYDEKNGIVKYINNSDPDLKIRTWTMEQFNKRWDGWVCAVYADEDKISMKWLASRIKIVDEGGLDFKTPEGYILFPR